MRPTAADRTTASTEDDLTITGAAYTAPEPSRVLTKTTSKGGSQGEPKGKEKLELPNLKDLNPAELQEVALNRLSESRDIINALARKQEVHPEPFVTCIGSCRPILNKKGDSLLYSGL
jgi:hypothetical protein